jgi:hypothetical protein
MTHDGVHALLAEFGLSGIPGISGRIRGVASSANPLSTARGLPRRSGFDPGRAAAQTDTASAVRDGLRIDDA